jgi:Aerotolerance regulator N-terminal/von Willebrand factor type A domain
VTFGAPLGLLALLAIPAVVAAYFLRRKQPPRVVSALFLWRTPDQRAEAGPRFERFSRELSLALETSALLFAALFLADVHCGSSAPRRHVVVVVDGGLSMNAKVDGQTAAERVKTAVAKLARDENAGVLTIIESGPRASLLAGPQQDVERALAALEGWTPAQPAHDVSPALVMAKDLTSSVDQRVFFFTDGPLPDETTVPPQVEGHSVGQAVDNLALLSAQRHDESGLATVTVRVGNFTDKSRDVVVVFEATDDAPQRQKVTLASGATAVVRAGFKSTAPITVSLPSDALAADDRVTLLPAPLAELTVGLLEGLDASARTALTRALAVTPSVAVKSPGALTVGPPGSSARVTVGAKGTLKAYVGPFFAQKGDPLFDDVQLGGVVWTAGENPPGRPLLSMGNAVLVAEDDDGALHLNLSLEKSNVQRTVAWPVLVGNLVRQARLASPGLPRKHLMLGEDVAVVTTSGASWSFRGPTKQVRPVLGVGQLTMPPLPQPGRWELLKDGAVVDELVVLPLDPRESDLRTRGAWEVEAAKPGALAALSSAAPRVWWPVLVMLALLVLDFWLTARTPRRLA